MDVPSLQVRAELTEATLLVVSLFGEVVLVFVREVFLRIPLPLGLRRLAALAIFLFNFRFCVQSCFLFL